MRMLALVFIMFVCNSCFLISDFRRTDFSYRNQGSARTVDLVVPKGYREKRMETDSGGNQVMYYFYPGNAVLYFAALRDTSKPIQEINYDMNIARELYQATYYKGVDTLGRYWRETRLGQYKAGYWNVPGGLDGNFDSAVNYFGLRLLRQ